MSDIAASVTVMNSRYEGGWPYHGSANWDGHGIDMEFTGIIHAGYYKLENMPSLQQDFNRAVPMQEPVQEIFVQEQQVALGRKRRRRGIRMCGGATVRGGQHGSGKGRRGQGY